jgi:hypothetical protein
MRQSRTITALHVRRQHQSDDQSDNQSDDQSDDSQSINPKRIGIIIDYNCCCS